ncbi:MAG TPA: transposase [Gaiellaceae bacterium]|nr:transposase [Gaiellaceae bacterium]
MRRRGGLARFAGARRFAWNWALDRRRGFYAEHGCGIPAAQLSAELTALKQAPGTAWLAEIDSQLLQQALADLSRAYTNFFGHRARFPRFESRKRDQARFRIPQRVVLRDGRLYCPKLGWIRVRQSQPIGPGETVKSATFKQTATGHWQVTLVAEF